MSQDLTQPEQNDFLKIATLIGERRARVVSLVNTELIELYWEIGKILSEKTHQEKWGSKVISNLAHYLKRTHPTLTGFSRPNLIRMRQFHETYPKNSMGSPLVNQLSWSHNLLILSQAKSEEERAFYLNQAHKEGWSKRELERQLKGALYERQTLNPPRVSPIVPQMHPKAESVFKDSYVVEFLNLAQSHSEADLHQS
jgi:predicted nuclease of restriction endonuclease-like (RecB) superfamily